jgi:hypothetical protein
MVRTAKVAAKCGTLASIQAAAAVGQADTTGAAIGSTQLTFTITCEQISKPSHLESRSQVSELAAATRAAVVFIPQSRIPFFQLNRNNQSGTDFSLFTAAD